MGYVDAGLGHNNPIRTVWNQAMRVWPPEEQTGFDPTSSKSDYRLFILSIGTGEAYRTSLKSDLWKVAQAIKSLATETERTNNEFSEEHRDVIENDLFFRLHGTFSQ